MVLYWSPKGTSDNWCSGIDAFQANRTGEQAWFVDINITITVTTFFFTLIPMLVWIMLQNDLKLQRMGVLVSLVAIFNTWLLFVPISLKRSIVDPVSKQPNFPCVAQAVIYVLVVSLNGACSLARIMTLIHKARASRAALQLKRLGEMDDVSSMASTKGENRVRTFFGDVRHTVKVIFWTLLRADRQKVYWEIDERASSSPQREAEAMLRLAQDGNSLRSLSITLIFFQIPSAVVLFIFVAIVDPWKSVRCLGCDLFIETIIVILLINVLSVALRVRVVQVLGNEPDPDNIVPDMKKAAFVMMGCLVSGFIVIAIDPGHLDYQYIVSWEWLIIIGSTGGWWYLGVKPLLGPISQRIFPVEQDHTILPPVEPALADPMVMARFEDFAERNFCVEMVRFYQDALNFERLWYERNDRWRTSQANRILDRYVRQDAILQVNISDSLRVEIEDKVTRGMVPSDLFKAAEHEVCKLIRLNHHLWPRFVAEGGLKDVGVRFKSSASTPKTTLTSHASASLPRVASSRSKMGELAAITTSSSSEFL